MSIDPLIEKAAEKGVPAVIGEIVRACRRPILAKTALLAARSEALGSEIKANIIHEGRLKRKTETERWRRLNELDEIETIAAQAQSRGGSPKQTRSEPER